jgi:non-specific serine/threonine protein kinase
LLPDRSIVSAGRALPAGACLDAFEIGETIGEGSSAIVYAATDRARAAPVAIAEYMPARLAQRNSEAQVTPRTSAQADAFAKGLKAFIRETRALERCNHPSLVRILRLWEANGTAYRVMPRYAGRPMLEVRRGIAEPPDEEAVRALLDGLLGALGIFHQTGGGHGKVTPSNILLLADNRPLLLASGAAGRVIASDRIDALMTSAEPCFAPIEQMVESADIPLRPSVDLYALAGVARYWMSGQLPAPAFGAPDSPRREKLADTVQRLHLSWPGLLYSASLLEALDSALSIYPAERPQSVAQMRARLGSAPAAQGGIVSATRSPIPARNDAVLLPPAPAMQPAPAAEPTPPAEPAAAARLAPPIPMAQDLDAAMASAPDPDAVAMSGVARIDDVPLLPRAFARGAPNPRRIATLSAVLVLLALVVGVFEFGQEGPVGRMLDTLGISRGTGVADNATVPASTAGPGAPVTPPIAADGEAPKPTPTETSAADSPTSATVPASPAGAPIAADVAGAKPTPAETTDAHSPADAAAPAPSANPNRGGTLGRAATAAPGAPPAVAPPPARTRPSTRVARQHASRAPASPREVCGPRTQFSLYRCMQMQCSQPRWASHAQCKRLRTTDSVD